MNWRRNSILTLTIAVACFCAEARADELQNKLLAAARATRADSFSFRRTIAIDGTDNPRKVMVEQYDPRRPAAQQWSLISVDGRAPTAKEIAESRKAKRGPVPSYGELAKWIGSPATRTDTSTGTVTYRFARLPAGTLKIGSHDASAHTQAEAIVNIKGKTPFVERIRFASTKKFKLMLVASVRSMTISGRYSLLPNGAAVPAEASSLLDGSMLGKSGQMKTMATFSDFRATR